MWKKSAKAYAGAASEEADLQVIRTVNTLDVLTKVFSMLVLLF